MQKRLKLENQVTMADQTTCEKSPGTGITNPPTCLLTPPASNRKSLEAVDLSESSTKYSID